MLSSNKNILFTNCSVYQHPNANSILCNNGLIEKIGLNIQQKGVEEIDLGGNYLYPGFIDSHLHLTGFGWSLEVLNLKGMNSIDDILLHISDAVKNKNRHSWLIGRGWDQNTWVIPEFPTKEMLDSVAKDIPVILRRVDGHAAWVNSKALEISRITKKTIGPVGGKIIRNADGTPTGILIDKAMDLVSKHIPSSTKDEKKRYINNSISTLNSLGITSLHDAGTDLETIHLLKDLKNQNDLSVRVYTMLNDDPEDTGYFFSNGPELDDPFLKIRAVKLYMDGALGSKGAAMIEPYVDDPNNFGLLLESPNTIGEKIQQANAAGFQVCVHCIGDRANHVALNLFEHHGKKELRNRIEHAQIIHKSDLMRFAQLGVLPSMQPTHCTADMSWVETRLGPHRLSRAYPWKSLLNAGSIIPGGSDAPIEYPSPLEGIYAAVTRQDKSGNPKNGWQSSEKISIHDAIKMMTSWGAYASFEENIKGTLLPGYFADFTVLDRPIESVTHKEILTSNVLYTILNGKIVFSC